MTVVGLSIVSAVPGTAIDIDDADGWGYWRGDVDGQVCEQWLRQGVVPKLGRPSTSHPLG